MFSEAYAGGAGPGEYQVEWIQLSNRDDAQGVEAGNEGRGGADYIHGPLSGEIQDVGNDRGRGAADGLAVAGAEWVEAQPEEGKGAGGIELSYWVIRLGMVRKQSGRDEPILGLLRCMEYLSCDCEKCKNGIEFPAHGVGRRINCPHCGAPVTLKNGAVIATAAQSLSKKEAGVVEAQFLEKAKQWREERVKVLLEEGRANIQAVVEMKMDRAVARKLRDLFQEIADEFERKASEGEVISNAGAKTEAKR